VADRTFTERSFDEGLTVDRTLPAEITDLLADLDAFIADEIAPLQAQDDNERFFDHRREYARTDFEHDGVPRREWEDLLDEMRRRADAAGFLRFGLPAELGGRNGSNLAMAVVREHLAHKGLGLHNDLQDESSVVGNFPVLQLLWTFGTDGQKAEFCEALITGERRAAFGLTEPDHGSDATWMETTAVRDGDHWVINGRKRWNTGVHRATHDLVFARTSGDGGKATGISAFLVPTDTPGFTVPFYWWTLNMPTDHGEVELRDVRVPASTMLGEEGRALAVAQHFVHENRIRQAASSLGAAQFCIDRSVAYARERVTFGRPLSERQAIQFPLVELHTDAELVRMLVRATAHELDHRPHMEVTDRVSMCNYRANRLVCDAADRAMQVHGGVGYSRHQPFEHIYRHHRRYRITEGSEEIQMRRVAGALFGYGAGRSTSSVSSASGGAVTASSTAPATDSGRR
jgi:alkylation response protein AidB-like acyl-CoA dehydrogenase